MARRRVANTTFYDRKRDLMQWRVEWLFHAGARARDADEGKKEKTPRSRARRTPRWTRPRRSEARCARTSRRVPGTPRVCTSSGGFDPPRESVSRSGGREGAGGRDRDLPRRRGAARGRPAVPPVGARRDVSREPEREARARVSHAARRGAAGGRSRVPARSRRRQFVIRFGTIRYEGFTRVRIKNTYVESTSETPRASFADARRVERRARECLFARVSSRRGPSRLSHARRSLHAPMSALSSSATSASRSSSVSSGTCQSITADEVRCERCGSTCFAQKEGGRAESDA